ncbi:hypothetical protein HMPREF1986_00353 [Oribacterium sp. oral taxon 078 str. F0263]|uniref:tail fiber domain-containing protein n=1 Tax=Oribacterium sp. oral taxon 078 TaxID=652706 RepID=UPI0003AD7A4D|nr:tail fiber domain-containing protein [Oribacterium sp. oral taxon 078]ERL22742.1 hypothetical protein HMPREF1986_00353 [Oribacterium sp. oral taxon 078 str. F0263]
MSVYKGESPESLKDYRQVRDYVQRINKAVQNVFHSLDPDDNFTEEEWNRYRETDGKISSLEMGLNGLRSFLKDKRKGVESLLMQQKDRISFKVKKGDVLNQLNLEPGALRISGNRLEILTNNFIVSGDRMYAAGDVTAYGGRIAGWRISREGEKQYWFGEGDSRIDVQEITAERGDAGTIKARGEVNIHSTFKGNFDQITCNGAVFDGGISCSCMQAMGNSRYTLTCEEVTCYSSYRDAGETFPEEPTHPSKEEYDTPHPNRYNTNSLPYGGIVADQVTCRAIYSKLSGETWSDRRKKEDIRDITEEEGRTLLHRLRPVSFRMKKSGAERMGYIAQEVPEEYREMTPEGYFGLRYASIATVLDKRLKEMSRRLKEEEVDG